MTWRDWSNRDLDTRIKILTAAQALETAARLRQEGRTLAAVTGSFDPVLAEHARRLVAAKGDADALAVVITNPRRMLLPARARAELVAALAVVDYVVLLEQDDPDFIEKLGARRVERQESGHEQLTEELTKHVRSRQQAR